MLYGNQNSLMDGRTNDAKTPRENTELSRINYSGHPTVVLRITDSKIKVLTALVGRLSLSVG